MSSDEHVLTLDLTAVDRVKRRRVISFARKAGGTVLNEDPSLLVASAPLKRMSALRREIFELEAEVQDRAPFSFYFPNARRDDDFKQRMKDRNVSLHGIDAAENALVYRGTRYAIGIEDQDSIEDSVDITQHTIQSPECGTRIGVTVHKPSEITADKLRKYSYYLGEKGARATLAVLVEVSNVSRLDSVQFS